MFEADATDAVPNVDLQEVRNYIAAVEHGITRLPDLPLSTRLMRECDGVLMSGVRGAEKTPGELRQSQNWIRAASATVADAAFVPPPPEDLGPTLQAWETYIHDPEPGLPLLIRSALLHYQFETIHPFLDGNGRLGRVFVVLHLPVHLLAVEAQCSGVAAVRPHAVDRFDQHAAGTSAGS